MRSKPGEGALLGFWEGPLTRRKGVDLSPGGRGGGRCVGLHPLLSSPFEGEVEPVGGREWGLQAFDDGSGLSPPTLNLSHEGEGGGPVSYKKFRESGVAE